MNTPHPAAQPQQGGCSWASEAPRGGSLVSVLPDQGPERHMATVGTDEGGKAISPLLLESVNVVSLLTS